MYDQAMTRSPGGSQLFGLLRDRITPRGSLSRRIAAVREAEEMRDLFDVPLGAGSFTHHSLHA